MASDSVLLALVLVALVLAFIGWRRQRAKLTSEYWRMLAIKRRTRSSYRPRRNWRR